MQPNNPVAIGPYLCGRDSELLLIAGPCALQIESAFEIARRLKEIVERLERRGYPVQLVFKGSFDKANRTSAKSWRGLGLEAGLALLDEI